MGKSGESLLASRLGSILDSAEVERRDEHIEATRQADDEHAASERQAEAEPTTGQHSDATSTTPSKPSGRARKWAPNRAQTGTAVLTKKKSTQNQQ